MLHCLAVLNKHLVYDVMTDGQLAANLCLIASEATLPYPLPDARDLEDLTCSCLAQISVISMALDKLPYALICRSDKG